MAGKKKEEGREYTGWGGARPGSGKKKGDRKRRSIWASDEEFEEIKKFIERLRARHNERSSNDDEKRA